MYGQAQAVKETGRQADRQTDNLMSEVQSWVGLGL